MTRGRPARSGHGSYGMSRRCNCEPCAVVRRRYQKQLNAEVWRGESRKIPAGPVREHVQRLLDAVPNTSEHMISKATGNQVHRTQVVRLLRGSRAGKEVTFLHRKTAAALMAVTLEQVQELTWLPAVGVQRRIRALWAQGHDTKVIAAALGTSQADVYNVFKRQRVEPVTHQRMVAVYEELASTEGADIAARWRARWNEWPPPAAWDDEALDDPDAPIPTGSMACIIEGCLTGAKKKSLCQTHYDQVSKLGGTKSLRRYREVVNLRAVRQRQVQPHAKEDILHDLRYLHELGFTVTQAAERLGRGRDYVAKLWREEVVSG